MQSAVGGRERVPKPEPRPKPPASSQSPAAPAKPLTLDSAISDVPGIGKANATSFKRLGLHTVRDLSHLLHPAMLDDLGLVPALEWQIRDFTRRFQIRVDLDVRADLEGLPEQYRTCIYRVVQEAMKRAQSRQKRWRMFMGQ